MKKIPLTQGQFALVDDGDYEWLNQWKWCAAKQTARTLYVIRMGNMGNGKERNIRMHREILGLKFGDRRQSDHIDHNGLNNQRFNLRICSHRQNSFNVKAHNDAKIPFIGITKHYGDPKYIARIWDGEKNLYIGRFDNIRQAAIARDKKALELFGEFAYLNFPDKKVDKSGKA